MKIVVTGATGFVGRSLVPLLAASGADLLLVGREPARIAQLFPDHPACGYDELARRGAGFDILVHLAVVNNDANVPEATFRDVNIRQAIAAVSRAKEARIPRFMNVSSTHALDPSNDSFYAQSKREVARLLANVEGIGVISVFMPAIYGDTWSGRLAILNALPRPLARILFQALAALRPTMHLSRLAAFVLERAIREENVQIVLSDGQHENVVYRFVKRMVDLGSALAVVLLFWWALALIWALVRLDSPGPGFFAQRRVGRAGREFTCYKFRTMWQGTAQVGTHQVSANDVTRLGRFLRRTKLDELPQVWNILRNEISLIGPRPCLPVQTELIEARRRRGVLRLKPGISGLAQINGIDMSDAETLTCWDARYMAFQSLLLDLRIALATATGKGGGDRVAAAQPGSPESHRQPSGEK